MYLNNIITHICNVVKTSKYSFKCSNICIMKKYNYVLICELASQILMPALVSFTLMTTAQEDRPPLLTRWNAVVSDLTTTFHYYMFIYIVIHYM